MLFTLKELAEIFQCHPQTLLQLANAGEFPKPLRLSRRLLRWRKVDIENYISAHAEKSETYENHIEE